MAKRKKSVESFGTTVNEPVASAADTSSAVYDAPPSAEPRPVTESESSDDLDRARADSRDHQVAARAYELYLERGGGHGRDVEDWLEAERQVGQRSDRPSDE